MNLVREAGQLSCNRSGHGKRLREPIPVEVNGRESPLSPQNGVSVPFLKRFGNVELLFPFARAHLFPMLRR